MATALKVLGQSDPAADTLTDMYTVPGSTEAVVSTITVANRSATATNFRLSVAVGGAADSDEQYFAYDVDIGANEVVALTLGLSLAATDVLRVYADDATLSFIAFGQEVT